MGESRAERVENTAKDRQHGASCAVIQRASGRRFLSVWLPHFSVERLSASGIAGKAGIDSGRPTVVVREERGRQVLAGLGRNASVRGLAAGQALADARALDPNLSVVEADPEGDQKALGALARWAVRWTPSVTLDPPSLETGEAGLRLDTTGADHLFGGEAALVADVIDRLTRLGFTARAALAGTTGAAWALARFAPGGRALVLPSGQENARLAGLPLAALRLPPAVIEGLERVGIRRIDALNRLPRAPLTARFGPVVAQRLDQALGRLPEPVSPLPPTPPHRVRLGFPEPILHTDDLLRTIRRLLDRLGERLAREQAGTRSVRIGFWRTDGEVREIAVRTARPTRDTAVLTRLLEEKLPLLDPGLGIDMAILEAAPPEAVGATQTGLAEEAEARAAAEVSALTDRLINRLGPDAVTRLSPVASRLPERAERAVPLGAEEGRTARTMDRAPAKRLSSPVTRAATLPIAPPIAPRPIRLLSRPERIEATALLPDHPPVRFRWRGADHRVARAAGPERIAPEWWRAGLTASIPDGIANGDEPGTQSTRDYFRVEDGTGRRWWLFREGLAERGEAPVWYLHGLMA